MTLEEARQLAAQVWCDKETSSIPMDVHLAEAFAKLLVQVTHIPGAKFRLGQRVRKVTGYQIDGTVVAIALTKDRSVRYVVEHDADKGGFLHIYSENNLLLLPPSSHAVQGLASRYFGADEPDVPIAAGVPTKECPMHPVPGRSCQPDRKALARGESTVLSCLWCGKPIS